MPPKRWSEAEAVELLARQFRTRAKSVVHGIGDDAAVLTAPRAPLVLTVDACIEGVHFDLRWLSLEDVGFRATMAAASDLAAMGARPLALLSQLTLPKKVGKGGLQRLSRGQAQAAKLISAPMVGGNLSAGGELGVTTTVIGSVKKPLLRSGARAGDELWLVGDVGMAAAGLRWLRTTKKKPTLAVRRCIEHWRRPRALIREGLALARSAHACCDVSDGLARDAGHIAEKSRIRLIVEESALLAALSPDLLAAALALRVSPLQLALGGGEDYALLCTGPSRRKPRLARRIGRIVKGRGAVFEKETGQVIALEGGFDHFS